MMYVDQFPGTFWFTGLIYGTLVLRYVIFAIAGGLSMSDLFLPKRPSAEHHDKAIHAANTTNDGGVQKIVNPIVNH
jgi:hypothetical protein